MKAVAVVVVLTVAMGLSQTSYARETKIVVDLAKLQWRAFSGETTIQQGKAVGGAFQCSDAPRSCKTPSGTYTVLRVFGPVRRSDLYPLDCINKQLCGAKMFWQVKFREDGLSIHGVNPSSLPNFNASHGCIRVSIEDAKWIRNWVIPERTRVVVLPY